MKTIVGVDGTGYYESTLNLLARLRPQEVDIEVIHVDDSKLLVSKQEFGFISGAELSQINSDDTLIMHAKVISEALGFRTSRKVLFGSPAKILLDHARKEKADLICIGSRRRSKFNSSLFGSMGRALAIGSKESVLISKGEVSPVGPLSVVLTTDHSKYSDRAIRTFIEQKPEGIKQLILLTAFDKKMVAGMNKDHRESFLEFIGKKSKKVVKRIREAGIPAEHRLWEGDLGEVVETQMDEVKADLLVMAAQGTGYADRLNIGSSALKQIVSSKHSIYLIRP